MYFFGILVFEECRFVFNTDSHIDSGQDPSALEALVSGKTAKLPKSSGWCSVQKNIYTYIPYESFCALGVLRGDFPIPSLLAEYVYNFPSIPLMVKTLS